ncbi:MAG: helix-turn-helix domain-containing protein [Chloroflexota bacterium]|nr:helix-turn-helix domain-containing protein [Chloroflexota bacterium]
MPKTVPFKLSPRVAQASAHLGENVRLARQRRRLTMEMVAERAGLSRVTLSKIEHGDPSVTLGAYASVLFVLGLEQQLETLAADDALGRKLQDLAVGRRVVPERRTSTRSVSPRSG